MTPPRTTEEICRVAVPELVSITFCGPLVTPWVTVPNDTLAGVRVTAGLVTGVPMPLPLSGTDCGEPGASSVITMLAVRCPPARGVKLTAIVQLALIAYAPLQELAILKSPGLAPLSRTEEMCSVALPAFVRVTVCAGLVLPWLVLGNERLPGISVTPGCGATPVPVRGMDCGLAGALSVAVRLAWRGPVAEGVKTTVIEQVPFGDSTVGMLQLGVAAKSVALVPLTVMEFRLKPCPPVFVSVAVCALLDCPRVMVPKFCEAGKRAATGPLTA